MNRYFDLHAHPTSKSFLTDEDPTKKVSPWKKIRGGFFQVIAPILKSQYNLSQCSKGKVTLGIYPIVPIEKGFSEYWLIEDILGTFIVLSKRFLKEINDGKYSYNDLFWAEYDHLNDHLQHKGQKVNILTSIEDLDEAEGVLNGIISIEGSHALIHPGTDPISKLKEIKSQELFSPLYLTLTHLTKHDYCNHAYGAKITKDPVFKPSDQLGISQTGLDIIQTAYSTEFGKRTLIDCKHMSVYSRFQFYRYRKDKGYDSIPILATHMGVTGIPLADLSNYIVEKAMVDHYTRVRYKEVHGIKGSKKKFDTDFNPWSINLYDEEIKMIIESGGLIGISLDQRILGFGKNTDEYFATKEFEHLSEDLFELGVNPHCENIHENPGFAAEFEEEEDFKEPDKASIFQLRGRKRRHLRYFCNTILHIVDVGGENAWDHICIGSDFDGLINPINNCKSCEGYSKLERQLIGELQTMASEGDGNYFMDNIEEKVRGVMYKNGYRFLQKYFNMNYLTGKETVPIA